MVAPKRPRELFQSQDSMAFGYICKEGGQEAKEGREKIEGEWL